MNSSVLRRADKMSQKIVPSGEEIGEEMVDEKGVFDNKEHKVS